MRAYCDHDPEKALANVHSRFTWIGIGEEHGHDRESLRAFLVRARAEQAPCAISDEEYRLASWDAHSCLVSGRCRIAGPETGIPGGHWRATFGFSLADGELKINLVHLSAERRDDEAFPARSGDRSEYLQKLVAEKNRQIAHLNSTLNSGLKANWDDEHYTLFYVNAGLCRMLGYAEDELLAKCRSRMTELVYPPDLPQALRECDRCFANSFTYSAEYRMQRKDGSLIRVWDTGSKSRDEAGRTVINSVIVDITEQRRAHDTIRRQQRFLQSLYDTMPCGLVQYSLKGTFLNANACTFDLIGYTREQFLAETNGSILSIVHPDDMLMASGHLDRLIRDRLPLSYNVRILRRDGETRLLCARANVIDDMNGVPVVQAVYTDVTDLRRAEAERRSTSDSIPGGVAKYLVGSRISLLEANDKYFQMVGGVRGAQPWDPFETVFPADREDCTSAFLEARGAPVDREYRCRRLDDGRTVWIHLIARPVETRHGATVYQCVFIDVTEQKETQIQLDRERDRYRLVMENSADVVYEYDIRTDVVVFYENIRDGQENRIVKHVVDRFSSAIRERGLAHPDDEDLVVRLFTGAQSGSAEVRLRNLARDGRFVWCLLQSRTVYENGAPARVVGLSRDITDTKRLLEEKERLQRIFDLELRRDYENICQIDPATGRYCMYTPAGRHYHDVPEAGDFAREVDRAILRFVCAEDREACLENMRIGSMLDKLSREEEGVFYYRVHDGGSGLRWKCARFSFFGTDGSILLNIRDVHDIRMAQQKEENRFRAILRETCEYIVETDVETGGCSLHFPSRTNPYPLETCADYAGLIAGYAQRYVAPQDREAFLDAVPLPAALDRMRRGETCSVGYAAPGDGSPAYKTWNMSLYRYDDDREYVLAYVLDVTRLVLEQQEKEREAERNRRIIKDALVAAEQASRAKSDFLSRMSHEIRTPMNAIIGMTAIAAASLDNRAKMADCLGKIGLSSRYLLSLINDILDMSRIESGKVAITSEEIDFRAFVEGITTIMYPQARDRRIAFDLNIEGLVGERYLGDPLRLNQVLINILSNALKFTPEGHAVSLTIRETRRVQDRAYLRFIVRDTGIGMEQDLLERIFEPFEQGISITNRFGGSGLGLAISGNLVSLMNGHISVTSKPGEGSEFVVELPLIAVPGESPRPEAPYKDLRVLIVDDDPVTCEHTTLILERIGVSADYVTSGQAALDRIRAAVRQRSVYDIALVDWQMPVMDGVETARNIRRIVGSDTLVIIMSAYDWTEIEDAARAAGVDFFIPKPMFQSAMRDVLLKATRRRQTPPQRPAEKEDFTGRRILLVEDNEINMEIARTLLEFRNAAVDGAVNGQEAVDLFRASPEGHYDAVLMDVRMPVMDGLAAARAIRALDRPDAPTVPILAMTANAFAEDIEETRKAGMDEHLAKPIETETLYASLARHFRAKAH